jgi:hypothetical protein
MRIKGSLATGALLAMGIALIPSTALSAENVVPASACKVLNQKVVQQNKTYTCIKSGGKLIWNKGAVVVKPSQPSTQTVTTTSAQTSTTTSTQTVTTTSTPTSAPTSALETDPPASTCSRNKNSLKNC